MVQVKNPILPGFNADPSAIRVGEEYYIVTSTFNWSPGVALYSSRDLKNWKHISNILNKESQLNLKGNPDSCGIWAPQISYNKQRELFYLVYTDVKNLSSSFFDLNNYMVTAPSILGPWSEPTYLNSSGFDPSLFHDDNGKSWLLNLAWEFREEYPHPGPIVIQQLDLDKNILVGNLEEIYRGNANFGCTEGPHMFKKDSFYYLITAEGGTGYGHAVKVVRSNTALGPFEESPNGPLLTSRQNINPKLLKQDTDFLKPQFYNPKLGIQKAGHGSLIETATGEFALFHLMSRPVMPQLRCTLNRETGVQKVIWKNNWPSLAHGNPWPKEVVDFNLDEQEFHDVTEPGILDFRKNELPENFYSLKDKITPSWCTLDKENGVLALKGRNSPYSAHDYSVLSRRVQHFNCDIETTLNFTPENIRHMAGLVIQTGSSTFYFVRYHYSESLKSTALDIMISLNGKLIREGKIALKCNSNLTLKASVRTSVISFSYSTNKTDFNKLGATYDSTVLSDEFTNSGPGAFDGTFAGMAVCDMDKHEKWAGFSSFIYKPI